MTPQTACALLAWSISAMLALWPARLEACTPQQLDDCGPPAVVAAARALQAALLEGALEKADAELGALSADIDPDDARQRLLLAWAEGEHAFHRGDAAAAAAAFARARHLAEGLQWLPWRDWLLVDEAIARRDSGEFWFALQTLESARAQQARSYRLDANLATLYAQMGAPDLALALLAPYANAPDRGHAADAAVRRAQLALDANDAAQALQWLQSWLCADEACGEEAALPALLRWWAIEIEAEALRRSGDPGAAQAAYLRLYEALPAPADRAVAELGLARIAAARGDWPEVAARVGRLPVGGEELHWAGLALLLQASDGALAAQALQTLTDALPRLTAALDPARVPDYRLQRRIEVLQAMLDTWLRRAGEQDLQAAFRWLPSLHSLSVGSSMPAVLPDPIGGRHPQAGTDVIVERKLGAREQVLERARGSADSLDVALHPEHSLAAPAADRLIWLIHGGHAMVRRGDRLYSTRIDISEHDLVNHVDLLVADDPAWRTTATRLFRQLGGELLARACAERPDPVPEAGRAAAGAQVAPVEQGRAACRIGTDLVIRADPLLADFPFASLLDDDGRLLLEQHALRMDDRVSGTPRLRQDRALVVAHSGAGLGAGGSWWQRLGAPPALLDAVRDEASGVARDWSARIVLAEGAARPAAVLQSLQMRPAVLHVAAHAVLNPWRPARSALLLAPDADGSPWWDAGRIARQRIEVDLVVLAACQSARRASPWRSGLTGLADAFIDAGADAVLGSLWSVQDAQSRDMMTRLYAHLPGQPVAEALRLAQLESLRAGQPPSMWAAWVLRD
jgi:tetratricopeptide (TPR) repeat protein